MSDFTPEQREKLFELEESRIEANHGILGARLMIGFGSGWLWWQYFEHREPGDGFRLGLAIMCTVVFLAYEGFLWGADRYHDSQVRAIRDGRDDS